MVLVNPFDNLDMATQTKLKKQLLDIASNKILVQLVSRLDDILPNTSNFFKLDGGNLHQYDSPEAFWNENKNEPISFSGAIPPPLSPVKVEGTELVSFKKYPLVLMGAKYWTKSIGLSKKASFGN